MTDVLPPYTFEYDGVTVTYHRAVVRSMLESRRLKLCLMEAYGYDNSAAVPADLWGNIEEYAAAMSQSKADAPWWTSSNATPGQIREAFELFMEQDPALFTAYLAANIAVLPSKKTMTSPSATSS